MLEVNPNITEISTLRAKKLNEHFSCEAKKLNELCHAYAKNHNELYRNHYMCI